MKTSDYFIIEKITKGEDRIEVVASIDNSHWICDVHFPDKPITPGAVITNTIQDIISDVFKRRYVINKIKSARFLSPIYPDSKEKVIFFISYTSNDGFEINVKANVFSSAELQFAKFSLSLIPATL